jgi:macrocin-O-methyltransferase TylF-like protien
MDQDVGRTGRAREAISSIAVPVLRRTHLVPQFRELREPRAYVRRARAHWRLSKGGFTMLGSRYGRNLQMLAERVEAERIPGALVDCGCWNGGSTMLLSDGAPSREVWAFDSFEGLPKPGSNDNERSRLYEGACVGSEEMLRAGFRDLRDEVRLHVVRGWFDRVLPASASKIGPISVLHVDADWYESIKLALETLYPLVSPGGFVAVDDYRYWPGARRAVRDFRRNHQIEAPLRSSHYWRKPDDAN